MRNRFDWRTDIGTPSRYLIVQLQLVSEVLSRGLVAFINNISNFRYRCARPVPFAFRWDGWWIKIRKVLFLTRWDTLFFLVFGSFPSQSTEDCYYRYINKIAFLNLGGCASLTGAPCPSSFPSKLFAGVEKTGGRSGRTPGRWSFPIFCRQREKKVQN